MAAKNTVSMANISEKHPLHDIRYVNTVIGMMYDKDGNYRAGFKPEEFYDAILLDTLKYGEENYVHLKYAENISVRKGKKTATFRRWAGLTPTLRPLREGIPPMPDKHAYETLEVGNVFSFGRWSEYTDMVDKEVVSEVAAERSNQYGENAAQVKELYARKTWLASPNEFYANFKNGFDELAFGDNVELDDLRWLTSRMKRMMVKAIGGKFNYICSPEWINGLIDDPRVAMYMKIEQTTGKLFTSGEPFDLFDLSFIPTMLDEFAYPDVEFPGVYELDGGKKVMRYYAIGSTNASGGTIYYLDVHQDLVVGSASTDTAMKLFTGYLKDGTAVEEQELWELPATETAAGKISSTSATIAANKYKVTKQRYAYGNPNEYGIKPKLWGAPATVTSDDLTAIADSIKAGDFAQLPVHRGILFGDEAMLKINMEGISDAPRIIIKDLGSAGTSDPLDQRRTIGYRVDGFGLAIKRPEAICVTYGIPTNAEFASLSAQYIYGDATPLFPLASEDSDYYESGSGYIDSSTKVLAINKPAINDTRSTAEVEADINALKGIDEEGSVGTAGSAVLNPNLVKKTGKGNGDNEI